jgi:hypothetical protein
MQSLEQIRTAAQTVLRRCQNNAHMDPRSVADIAQVLANLVDVLIATGGLGGAIITSEPARDVPAEQPERASKK